MRVGPAFGTVAARVRRVIDSYYSNETPVSLTRPVHRTLARGPSPAYMTHNSDNIL